MEELKSYGNIPIEYSALLSHLYHYKSPADKVARMQNSGSLIHLKRGLYILSPEISGQPVSMELIANHLYGPSYVSFESALSLNGLIPERTYMLRSATSKRKKMFQTPVGSFEYITVPESYFPIGVQQRIIRNTFAFLVAGPEKALCDLILTTAGLRFQSLKALNNYLVHDLRIDLDGVEEWNPEIVEACSGQGYKKKELSLLYKLLRNG